MKEQIKIRSPWFQDTYFRTFLTRRKRVRKTGKLANNCCTFCTSKICVSLLTSSSLTSALSLHLDTCTLFLFYRLNVKTLYRKFNIFNPFYVEKYVIQLLLFCFYDQQTHTYYHKRVYHNILFV